MLRKYPRMKRGWEVKVRDINGETDCFLHPWVRRGLGRLVVGGAPGTRGTLSWSHWNSVENIPETMKINSDRGQWRVQGRAKEPLETITAAHKNSDTLSTGKSFPPFEITVCPRAPTAVLNYTFIPFPHGTAQPRSVQNLQAQRRRSKWNINCLITYI